MTFFSNILIAILAFGSWYLVGLGPAFVLLPSSLRREGYLLAPLIGMCLLALIGLFEITVLLIPLVPRVNLAALVIISVLLYFGVKRFVPQESSCDSPKESMLLCWFPLLILILVFAWMFHREGYHLLVGGSDQLQYCLDSRHISQVMHTGSILDMPIPRYDHVVYELITRFLAYAKEYRRGAEVLLASVTASTGLSFGQAFPVLVLCSLLELGLVLAFIGRVFFCLSLGMCFVLQILFFSSFYFLLLHVQGSVALILSIAPVFATLAFLVYLVKYPSWRCIILSAIAMAASCSIYCEPALVNIVLPSFILLAWQFYQKGSTGFVLVGRLSVVYFFAFLFAPFVFYSIAYNSIVNVSNILSNLNAGSGGVLSTMSIDAMLRLWPLAGVILGSYSYYDSSSFNVNIASIFASNPWVSLIGFYILCSCGLLGYVKNRSPLAYLYAIILTVWACASLLFSFQMDYLRHARSLHYAMPFILIGLVLLASNRNVFLSDHSGSRYWRVLTYIGRVCLFVFIVVNIYTVVRTVKYFTAHTTTDSSIILRFNERDTLWKSLRNELLGSLESNSPILISGFTDTIRPLAIVSVAPEVRHVLGSSITSFWPLYHIRDTMVRQYKYPDFNLRSSRTAYEEALEKENKYWKESKILDLEKHSVQAVVPVGHGYPVEWLDTKDVFAPRINRFPTICDVIYRHDYVVTLPSNMVSSLKKDASGVYRLIQISGPVIVHHRNGFFQQYRLTLDYDGKVGDLKLQIRSHLYDGQSLKSDSKIRITAIVSSYDFKRMNLIISNPVKLRSMVWEPYEIT